MSVTESAEIRRIQLDEAADNTPAAARRAVSPTCPTRMVRRADETAGPSRRDDRCRATCGSVRHLSTLGIRPARLWSARCVSDEGARALPPA